MTVKHTATFDLSAALTPLSVFRLAITQQDGGRRTKKRAAEEEVELPAAFYNGYTVRSLDADE
jgi:hypothetical protein